MILSHKYKFVFIHLGKTGGTAIANTLCPLVGIDFGLTMYNPEIYPGKNCKHISARELKQVLGEKIWQEYFTFCFVRNPYDMLLSAWSMHKQVDGSLSWVNQDWRRYDTFRDFLQGLLIKETKFPENFQTNMLLDENDELLVDFIGKFENLQKDFDAVCDRIGIKKTILEHLGPSKHEPYNSYYTASTATVVYDLFRKDFELLGYQKDIERGSGPWRKILRLDSFAKILKI